MYIELHARSAFSFLEGASVPEELVEVCATYQMPAMALLDRDGVYGAPRFHLAAKKLKIKAHIGAEITSLLPPYSKIGEPATSRVSLLCASQEGYQNLCRLLTRMKLRAPKYPAAPPRRAKAVFDDELLLSSQAIASVTDLHEYASGLVCLTGGDEGPLAHALANGGLEAGRSTLEQSIATFGRENVYIELQRHYN
ncbi:MAG: PHP domain-containing protein, partial [Candidatus Korobacteraceae bacterium]